MESTFNRLAQTHGYLSRPALLNAGHDDDAIRSAKRAGDLLTIGPGLYVTPTFTELTAEEQHAIRCHASVSRFPGTVAVSHQSAAVLHGAALWDIDLSLVHVTRLDSASGRQHSGVVHHVSALEMDQVTEINGMKTTVPSRTAWDIATTQPIENAVVAVDSLWHKSRFPWDELVSLAENNIRWKGARRAKIALHLADPLSESPGESRLRLLFREGHLPEPVLQHPIRDHSGRLIARTDFAWLEQGLVGEFDGKVKYGRSEDLFAEKKREDAIREAGWEVIRFVWADLAPSKRRETAERTRLALDRANQMRKKRIS